MDNRYGKRVLCLAKKKPFSQFIQIILKTSSSPTSTATSTTLPQGQILQTADGQLIILQSAEQAQPQQTQYVQVGGQSNNIVFEQRNEFEYLIAEL